MQAHPGGSEPEYEQEIMDILRQSRKAALCFLETAENIPRALAAILLYAHDVQAALDGDSAPLPAPEDCLCKIEHYHGNGNIAEILAFFRSLEILTPHWRQLLETAPQPIQWDRPLGKLAGYFFTRYWLQAISDYDLICRVKLAITACLLVGSLGGNIVETAQLFSKEIENDPDNVDAILDGAYTSPALTDANLLALLTKE